jgi:hypothetical protein
MLNWGALLSTCNVLYLFSRSDKLKIQCKIRDEYSAVKNLPIPKETTPGLPTEQLKRSHPEQGNMKYCHVTNYA